MLEVGDGQLVYWEACGNPDGKPAVVLHGGPGTGRSPGMRRLFDPDAYRVVLFDQRGCGRSLPDAGDPATDLSVNTTHRLLGDIERVRRHLGVERWLVFGGSWGSALALAYAERHPDRVTEVVLSAVGTTRRHEVEWLTRRVGRLFPEQWARFRDGVPAGDRDGDLAEAYSRLLADPAPAVRERAVRDWCRWEDAHVAVRADHRPNPSYDAPTFRMTFARLVTHYWRHAAFLEDGILLAEVGRLGGIPGVLVHGRLDVSSPLDIAWELARAWPDAELVVVDEAGHSAADPGMTEAVVAATDRFARRRGPWTWPCVRFAMPTSGSAAGYDARRLLGVGSFLRGAALSASGTGEPIAHGRDAEVYALGDGRVLRRYRRPGPTDHELRVMAHARSCGFPVPQVYERTETDLVMDYLDGPTMLADLTRRPWRLFRHAKTLAQLHRQLHAIPAPADLPAPVGEGTSLVHLDLHPGNVLLTASGPMVIDWPTQAAAAAWPTWPAPG